MYNISDLFYAFVPKNLHYTLLTCANDYGPFEYDQPVQHTFKFSLQTLFTDTAAH